MMLALVLAAAAVIPSIDPDTAVVREAAGAHYVLVSTREPDATEFRSFRIVDGEVTEEPVEVV